MRKFLCAIFVLALVVGGGRAARADPIVLDQAFVPTHGFLYAELLDNYVRAQTFTVGVSGLLTGFDVLLSAPGTGGSVTFGIYSTTGGVPNVNASPLAQATIAVPGGLTDTANFYSADVTAAGLMVNAGEVYAIVTSPGGPGPATWRGAYDPDALDVAHYAGGTLYATGWTGSLDPFSADLGFRTWVDINPGEAPVPEPASTLFLFAAGLGGLAGARRKWRG